MHARDADTGNALVDQISSSIPAVCGSRHKLTLQFADAEHKSYGPAFAKTITVNVKGS